MPDAAADAAVALRRPLLLRLLRLPRLMSPPLPMMMLQLLLWCGTKSRNLDLTPQTGSVTLQQFGAGWTAAGWRARDAGRSRRRRSTASTNSQYCRGPTPTSSTTISWTPQSPWLQHHSSALSRQEPDSTHSPIVCSRPRRPLHALLQLRHLPSPLTRYPIVRYRRPPELCRPTLQHGHMVRSSCHRTPPLTAALSIACHCTVLWSADLPIVIATHQIVQCSYHSRLKTGPHLGFGTDALDATACTYRYCSPAGCYHGGAR